MSIWQKFCIHHNLIKNTKKYKKIIIVICFILLLITSILGLLIGAVKVSLKDIVAALTFQNQGTISFQLITTIRLPRVIAGLFSGIALSVAGVILQSIMNNSLASPNIIGVNSGAGLAVLVVLIIFPKWMPFVPVAAFIGAFITTSIIFLISYKTSISRITIVLAGVAMSSFIGACINTLTLLFPDIAINANSFMIGGLSGVLMSRIIYAVIYIAIAFIICIFLAPNLNILQLGDSVASSLGLNVNRYRLIFILLSSTLAGSAISYSGLLGFVGLIVPHICRYLVGNDARFLIPCSGIVGGIFVIGSDLIGRVIFSPYELPVGIIMSFIGAPFFIFLLIKNKGRRLNA